MANKTALEPDDIKAFEPEAKIGLLATINPEGRPHLTLITSIRAKTTNKLMWGQFTVGLSKIHVQNNPKTAFLVLTMDKRLWRGKARWTHLAREGEDYQLYNNQPMFRYNAYFGINTVHYMDLVETKGQEKLPMARLMVSSILTKIARSSRLNALETQVLKPWAQNLFNNLGNLKFLAHMDDDGYPTIIPLIQCQAADSRTLIFSPIAYSAELVRLTPGRPAAIFGLTMKMEDVLVRGTFIGFERRSLIKVGRLDIDWVYNSMPPKQGQIYPRQELRPIKDFPIHIPKAGGTQDHHQAS